MRCWRLTYSVIEQIIEMPKRICFSVAKATLHSQMSVCWSITKTPQQLEIIILHFIILHSSFLHFATLKLLSLFSRSLSFFLLCCQLSICLSMTKIKIYHQSPSNVINSHQWSSMDNCYQSIIINHHLLQLLSIA